MVRSDHSMSFGHISRGNPRRSPIIIAGSGAARSPTISALPPLASTASSRSRDRRANVVFPVRHRARGEAARHQLPPLRVQRVVDADDGVVGGQVRAVAALLLVGVDEDVFRLLDLEDVVVARDPPQLVDRVPVDGRVLAQPRVRRVRIADVEVAVEQVDDAVGGVGRHASPRPLRASITSHPSAGSMNEVKFGPRRRW